MYFNRPVVQLDLERTIFATCPRDKDRIEAQHCSTLNDFNFRKYLYEKNATLL